VERGYLATSNYCEILRYLSAQSNLILARVTVVLVDQIGLITDRSFRSISRSWFYSRGKTCARRVCSRMVAS